MYMYSSGQNKINILFPFNGVTVSVLRPLSLRFHIASTSTRENTHGHSKGCWQCMRTATWNDRGMSSYLYVHSYVDRSSYVDGCLNALHDTQTSSWQSISHAVSTKIDSWSRVRVSWRAAMHVARSHIVMHVPLGLWPLALVLHIAVHVPQQSFSYSRSMMFFSLSSNFSSQSINACILTCMMHFEYCKFRCPMTKRVHLCHFTF